MLQYVGCFERVVSYCSALGDDPGGGMPFRRLVQVLSVGPGGTSPAVPRVCCRDSGTCGRRAAAKPVASRGFSTGVFSGPFLRFSLRFQSGPSKPKFRKADRPKTPNREREYPWGGKSTPTGFAATTTARAESRLCRDRPTPPGPTPRATTVGIPPLARSTPAVAPLYLPRTGVDVRRCITEARLTAGTDDAAHGQSRRRDPLPGNGTRTQKIASAAKRLLAFCGASRVEGG